MPIAMASAKRGRLRRPNGYLEVHGINSIENVSVSDVEVPRPSDGVGGDASDGTGGTGGTAIQGGQQPKHNRVH